MHLLEPLAAVDDELVDYAVKPNFRALGRRFGRRTPAGRRGHRGSRPRRAGGRTCVLPGPHLSWSTGAPVGLDADDVIVTQTPRSGWAVAADGGETVALDVTITPELRREGLAREVVRLVQDARKSDGLNVSDRIWLRWSTDDRRAGRGADGARGHDRRRGACGPLRPA